MNGEIFNACNIVTTAKRTLLDSSNVKYTPSQYEETVEFVLLQYGLFKKRKVLKGVENWCKLHLSKNVSDIKLIILNNLDNTNSLAFSGGVEIYIACFYNNGDITILIPKWKFLNDVKRWKITYTEEKASKEYVKPKFNNFELELLKTLDEIEGLARIIKADYFANQFLHAKKNLSCEIFDTTPPYIIPRLNLPKNNLKLFTAVQYAYVFGGMGSWNDGPRNTAYEMNLENEYNILSHKLYEYIIRTTLFAINEW